jgi:hypothetical protein
MNFRSNRPRNLAVSVAALLALLASANLASASLSTTDKSSDGVQQVALKAPDADQAKPAATQTATEQTDQTQQDQAKPATETNTAATNTEAKEAETKKEETPKQETHKVHVKHVQKSNVVCFDVHGLCKVLRVQPRPVFVRPVRFFRAW